MISYLNRPIIAPSLLAAGSGNYGEAVAAVERAGAGYLHIDVMDGHFVPNLSFGPNIVEGIRGGTSLYIDVHLMIEHPERITPAFIEAGADCITVHGEAPGDAGAVMKKCREHNIGFGISIKPGTQVAEYRRWYPWCDILLIMGVEPGFGGQAFIPATVGRIAEAKQLREGLGARYKISVDGGVNLETAPLCVSAGVDILVAGTTVFCAGDPADIINRLRGG